jgi:hypothetical protein
VLNGYSYPASERGPGTNDWGHYGWTYYRLPDARARYDQLNGRDNMPAGNGQAKNGIAQAARDAAGTVINALSGII